MISIILSYLNLNSGLGPSGHKFSGGHTLQGFPGGGLKIWIPLLVKQISLGLNICFPSKEASTH